MPSGFPRLPLAVAALLAVLPLSAETVSISVFGLFRPQGLIVSPAPGSRLKVSSASVSLTLEGRQSATLARQGASITVSSSAATALAESVSAAPSAVGSRFVLEIPGKIRREFRGVLHVRARDTALEAVVDMDLESAVAAIVAAEGGDAAPEALAALAVAARSYLTSAAGRHAGNRFCDTTHCQYLADPPASGSRAAEAATRTRGLVVSYRGQGFVPLYSRACGGVTNTPSEVGLIDGVYPYRGVHCSICSAGQKRWATDRPRTDLAAILSRPGNENARLEVVRKLGWSAVPSNRYEIRRQGDRVRIEGVGEGHGVGLCQRGAAGLARAGRSFREILGHYFPGATLTELPVR